MRHFLNLIIGVYHKTFCSCWAFYLGLHNQVLCFIHYLFRRVVRQAASLWIHPDNSWAEQFRAQPALHPVMGSFTLSAGRHDWVENSNCSPSPGQPHLTDIILSDLRSELTCSRFLEAGRHLVTQSGWRTFFWHQIGPLFYNPPPTFISTEWKKKRLSFLHNVEISYVL